jgi:hypothetical protein
MTSATINATNPFMPQRIKEVFQEMEAIMQKGNISLKTKAKFDEILNSFLRC